MLHDIGHLLHRESTAACDSCTHDRHELNALFRRSPHFAAALRLWRRDEAAKVPGLATPYPARYRAIVAGCPAV